MEQTHPELDLQVTDLESLESPDDWGDFWKGVAVGVALVGLYAAGAALT